MDLNSLPELLGEKTTIALAGLVVGLLFGICAQRSRFCLRSAVVEFWNRQGSAKLAIWLFAFSSAIVATQFFITQGWLDVGQARQLSATGSLSGALVGGLLFGIGMILARGCRVAHAGPRRHRQPARPAHRADLRRHRPGRPERRAVAGPHLALQPMDHRGWRRPRPARHLSPGPLRRPRLRLRLARHRHPFRPAAPGSAGASGWVPSASA